jgi:hypothetical protein
MRVITLLLLATNVFASTVVTYDARIILGGSNPVALNDFLDRFNLNVVSSPEGSEIPISGSFSFEHPQPNQLIGTGAQQPACIPKPRARHPERGREPG